MIPLEPETLGLAGGVVLVARGLEHIATSMIKKRNGKSNGSKELIRRVFDLVSRVDDDGAPLIYVPRSLIAVNEKILTKLSDIDKTLGNVAITNISTTEALNKLYGVLVEERPRGR